MNISIVTKIMPKYIKCPICGHDKLGKGHGGLVITDGKFERSCRCGFIIILDENENILLHNYESQGNTYCGVCGSKVEGGYCDCVAKKIRGEK